MLQNSSVEKRKAIKHKYSSKIKKNPKRTRSEYTTGKLPVISVKITNTIKW